MLSLKKVVASVLSLIIINPLYAASALDSALAYDRTRFVQKSIVQDNEVPLSEETSEALTKFNKRTNSSWTIRMNEKRKAPRSLVGGKNLKLSATEKGALSFLKSNEDLLKVDSKSLKLKQSRKSAIGTHFYFEQYYKGVRVENAYVKVNVNKQGELMNYQSTYIPDLDIDLNYPISADEAKQNALTDCGGNNITKNPEKIIFLDPATDVYTPAYNVQVQGGAQAPGKWVYYISALDGKVLNRVSRLYYANRTETFNAKIYPVWPSTPEIPAPPAEEVKLESLTVFAVDASTTTATSTIQQTTNANGEVNIDENRGRVFTTFTGDYFTITNQITPTLNSTYYIEGKSYAWEPSAFNNHTFHSCGAGKYPAFATPIFSSDFNVGAMSNNGTITDKVFHIVTNESLKGIDGKNRKIGAYIGQRKDDFKGPIVPNLDQNQSIKFSFFGDGSKAVSNLTGYEKICIDNEATTGEEFTTTHLVNNDGTDDGFISSPEASAYYNLMQIRNYFKNNFNNNGGKSNLYVNLEEHLPVQVNALGHAYETPLLNGMTNAFYDADANLFMYGEGKRDGGEYHNYALEAAIVRHEYVHYVMEKIWPIYYSGTSAAIAEGYADYFALSSLKQENYDVAVIGQYVGMELRNLSGNKTFSPSVWAENNASVGGYYRNSMVVSQVLWDIRTLDTDIANNADKIAWNALMFFPESLLELRDAIIASAKSLGLTEEKITIIESYFNERNIKEESLSVKNGDVYEPNNSPTSAADIGSSSLSSKTISARIAPASDLDAYSLVLPQGEFKATLHLPTALKRGATSHIVLAMALLDSKMKTLVKEVLPNDVNIGEYDITSTEASSTLTYNIPARLSGEDSKYVLVVYKYAKGYYPPEVNENDATLGAYTLDLSYTKGKGMSVVDTKTFDKTNTINFSVPYNKMGNIDTTLPEPLTEWSPNLVERFYSVRLLDVNMTPLLDSDDNIIEAQGESDNECLSVSNIQYVDVDAEQSKITGTVKIKDDPNKCKIFEDNKQIYLQVFGKLRTSVIEQTGGENERYGIVSLGISSPLINKENSGKDLYVKRSVFNPAKGGKFELEINPKEGGNLVIQVFTLDGLLVKTLYDNSVEKGLPVYIDWDGKNGDGTTVASGLYLLRVDGDGFNRYLKKIVVVK